MKTELMQTVNVLAIELQLGVEGSSDYHFFKKIFKILLLFFSLRPGLKSSGGLYWSGL